jgi:hypothetical protein
MERNKNQEGLPMEVSCHLRSLKAINLLFLEKPGVWKNRKHEGEDFGLWKPLSNVERKTCG